MNEKPATAGTGDVSPRREDLSISLGRANVLAVFVVIPAVVLLIVAFAMFHGNPMVLLARHTGAGSMIAAAGALLVGIVVHEAIHGAVWAFWGTGSFSTVTFGFNLRVLTPYAHATVPMPVRPYRWGAAAPLLILGVAPAVWGIVTGDALPWCLGVVFVAAAGGDILVLWSIRHVPEGALVEDHPTRAGCSVLLPGSGPAEGPDRGKSIPG